MITAVLTDSGNSKLLAGLSATRYYFQLEHCCLLSMMADESAPLVPDTDLEQGMPADQDEGSIPARPESAGTAHVTSRAFPSSFADAASAGQAIDGSSGMASFTRWMEQNVPFLVLLAIVFIYEHWGGMRSPQLPPPCARLVVIVSSFLQTC